MEWHVSDTEAGQRLDKFLAAAGRLGSRARAAAAIDRGKVFLNDTEATMADAAVSLRSGDRVRLWMDRPGSAQARPRGRQAGDLRIVYEDADIAVVDKPPGVLSVPLERHRGVPSVFDQLEREMRSHGKQRPLVVHRIDQDTSGLVLFAKHLAAQAHLRAQFKRREPERIYLAIVYGVPDPPSGTWRDHLAWDEKALIQKETHPRAPDASEAISDYLVVERLRGASLIEVRLRTGRRNQVRIQARLRGHTLVGEKRYVYGPASLRPIAFARHALHAYRLGFRHPADGRPLQFEAPPPADFDDLRMRLRLTPAAGR